MYMITRTCKVIPKIITNVRRVSLPLDLLHDDAWICCRPAPAPDASQRHLSSQTEYKHTTCKNLAQSKREQEWCYDPTIKYEAHRQCAVPRMAYYDYSATDWTDSSGSEIEIETMTEEEAQSQNAKILAEAKEEQPFPYYPTINYEVLKKFHYLDSPDSLTYSNLILGTDPKEELQSKLDNFHCEATQKQLCFFNCKTNDTKKEVKILAETKTNTELKSKAETELENETGTDTMAEEEAARKDKILVGTRDEQLFSYDPSVSYEPLKRYIVPRFSFFDSSSTDWSDSSESSAYGFSDSESETESMAKKEAVLNSSFVVSHEAKSPAEVGDEVLKPAKEMDSYVGVEKLTEDD